MIYAETTVGSVFDSGEGEGKEGEKVDPDRFLQQALNRMPTAGGCYLSRSQCLFFDCEEFYPSSG
jgi:hypothetical protein